MNANYTIRPAVPGDGAVILALVKALAEYEREPLAVVATATNFDDALLRGCEALLVFAARESEGSAVDSTPSKPVAFALWFPTFSTWLGKPGIHLEDLFVVPEHRGRGLGKMLLAHLAALTVSRGYGRLEWQVLDWNTPAIAFYEALGAKGMREWYTYRLDGAALVHLAESGSGARA
jgi:GNAT superfamily N-acetyltransferase